MNWRWMDVLSSPIPVGPANVLELMARELEHAALEARLHPGGVRVVLVEAARRPALEDMVTTPRFQRALVRRLAAGSALRSAPPPLVVRYRLDPEVDRPRIRVEAGLPLPPRVMVSGPLVVGGPYRSDQGQDCILAGRGRRRRASAGGLNHVVFADSARFVSSTAFRLQYDPLVEAWALFVGARSRGLVRRVRAGRERELPWSGGVQVASGDEVLLVARDELEGAHTRCRLRLLPAADEDGGER